MKYIIDTITQTLQQLEPKDEAQLLSTLNRSLLQQQLYIIDALPISIVNKKSRIKSSEVQGKVR